MLHIEGSHVLNPAPLSYLEALAVLNIKDNYLGDLESVEYFIRALKNLNHLDMRGNPVTKVQKFHANVIVLLPNLSMH